MPRFASDHTPEMLPRPDPDLARQSAKDWFKLFKAVAGGLEQLYCSIGQEIIGQRQALATLTALLNRNESERKLTTRILTECENLEQAEELARLTIRDLRVRMSSSRHHLRYEER